MVSSSFLSTWAWRNFLFTFAIVVISQTSQGNLDFIEAAKDGEAETVAALLTREDVDKNYQDEVTHASL